MIQQGDGRCILFDENGDVSQPIPWDNRCESNVTTSMCDNDVFTSIRHKIIDLDQNPISACFVCSDGIEDSFIGMEGTYAFFRKECMDIIHKLKFRETSDIFGIERDNGLESIINNVYQSFDKKDVYPSVEEKAANFLYLVVKNHVFIDGNKRIAATLFLYFLNYYGILYKNGVQTIDNNTLAALTLLIAESNPKEKEVIIDLVMNFLNNE